MIEAPFALGEEEVEGMARDAVEAAQVALGLAPEVLDAVDVGATSSKAFAMVDAEVAEA